MFGPDKAGMDNAWFWSNIALCSNFAGQPYRLEPRRAEAFQLSRCPNS